MRYATAGLPCRSSSCCGIVFVTAKSPDLLDRPKPVIQISSRREMDTQVLEGLFAGGLVLVCQWASVDVQEQDLVS